MLLQYFSDPSPCLTLLICVVQSFPFHAAPPYPVALGNLTPPFTYPAITKVALRLCQAAAVLILIKLLPSLVALLGAQQLLGDALATHLPARVLSVLLTNTCADPELACGAKLCTLVRTHLPSTHKLG
jgi:hypothetical protein